LAGGPPADFVRRRKPGWVDLDDGRIRRTEFNAVPKRLGVNILYKLQSIVSPLGQTDQLFEPGRARSLQMHSDVELLHEAKNGRINRELVAAGMDAELEIMRQTVLTHCVFDRRDVKRHLVLESRNVSLVIDTLVEAPAELGGNGLDRYALVGDCSEDDQKFSRALRTVGFVH